MDLRKYIYSFILLLGALTAPGRDFTNYQRSDHVKFRLVSSVCVDDNNFVWASNRMGVVRFSSTTQQQYRLPRAATTVSSVNLFKHDGTIFAYNDRGGVFRYSELSDSFETYLDLSGMIDAIFFTVNKIVCDCGGRLWILSSAGLLMYDEAGGLSVIAGTNVVSSIASITCSAEGTIFVVSAKGIVEIDGKTLKKYTLYPADSRFVSYSSYFDESQQRLWIGTGFDGLKYFDLETRQVTEIPGSSKVAIRAMTPYKDGVLMVGFDGDGVWFVDMGTGAILEKERKDYDNPKSLGSNGVYDICYNCSTIYVATYSGGLYACDDRLPAIVHTVHRPNDSNSLADNNVHSIIEDSSGRNVAATDNGVSIFDLEKRQWFHICQGNICIRAMEDSRGRYWIGTYDNGWFVYDSATLKELEHHRYSPVGKSNFPLAARNFIEDNEGDIWIFCRGMILRKDSRTGLYTEYPSYTVADACVLKDGTLALACSHALIVLDKYENSEKILWTGNVHDVTCNSAGIWAGTSGNGVVHVPDGTDECEFITTKDGLSSDFVGSVEIVGQDLWVGTEIGLNRYDMSLRQIQTYKSIPLLGYSNFNNGASDVQKDGALLFGTGDGILKFHPDQILHQTVQASMYVENIHFSGESVRDMFSVAPNQVKSLKIKHSQNNVVFTFFSSGMSGSTHFFKWRMDPVDKAWSPLNTDGRCRYTNLPSGENVFHLVMTDALGHELDSRDIVIRVNPPFWMTWWFVLLVLIFLYACVMSAWVAYSMKIKQRVVPLFDINREVEKHVTIMDNKERDPFVEKAVEVVYAKMQDPDFDKDSFAAEMNVSASSLYKKLKSLTGQSPAEFIKTIRMSTALKLLQVHQHTITEVSEMCGYSSQSYFSTAFKNFYGKSPNEI